MLSNASTNDIYVTNTWFLSVHKDTDPNLKSLDNKNDTEL